MSVYGSAWTLHWWGGISGSFCSFTDETSVFFLTRWHSSHALQQVSHPPVNSTIHQKLHTTDIIYPSRPEPHSGTANTEEKEHSKAYFFTVITIIVWYSQAHLQRLQSRKSRSWWKPLQSLFSLSVTTTARCMCFVKQITADKYRQCSHGDGNKGAELRALHHALLKYKLVCDSQASSHTHTNTTGYYREAGMHTCMFPCEHSTVINFQVYFIEKYTASSIESGLVSPNPVE